jgi:hypothetical protein
MAGSSDGRNAPSAASRASDGAGATTTAPIHASRASASVGAAPAESIDTEKPLGRTACCSARAAPRGSSTRASTKPHRSWSSVRGRVSRGPIAAASVRCTTASVAGSRSVAPARSSESSAGSSALPASSISESL